LTEEMAREHPWAIDAVNYLDRRRAAGAAGECALPELFTAVAAHHGELTLTAFQEGLRKMHHRRAVLLRPAPDDGVMDRPEYALLDGDCVYYYAQR
jgi:hypothetical protein